MNRLSLVLIMVVGLVLVGAAAQAETCDFDANGGSSGDWDVADNWDCTSSGAKVPTANDRAVIKSGKTCNIDESTSVDSIDVESTATLNVEASRTLRIDDTDDRDSTVEGTLNLEGSGSVLAFTTTDQTINGSGKIVGHHGSALITITLGDVLTNDTTIEGALKILGDGTFVNSGMVHANSAGTLEVSTVTFDDDSGGVWQVSTSSNAILKLDMSGSAAALEGAFTISAGTLDVESPGCETSGRLTFDLGTIDCSGLTGSQVAKFTG